MFVPDIVTLVKNAHAVKKLGNASRGFGRHADGQKVIVVNLGYFSA